MPKPLPPLDTVASAEACCTPLADAPISAGDAAELASRLKALADPTRLRLVSLMLVSESGEVCTCDVTQPLGLSQPTVSHHFKILVKAGLATGERRGTWTYYRAEPGALAGLAAVIAPATTSST